MKYLATALLVLASTAASAHPPLPNADWCSSGNAIVAATFDFTEADIDAYTACVHDGDCADPTADDSQICGGRLKSCGNFDDDYGKAALKINAFCAEYADPTVAGRGSAAAPSTASPPPLADGIVVPIVNSSSVFNSPLHHTRYHKSYGIQGVCAKCAPPVQRSSQQIQR